jgi:hypothetical protein
MTTGAAARGGMMSGVGSVDIPRRISAAVVWGIGLWTTTAFLQQVGVVDYTWLWAIGVQTVLTGAQSAFWANRANGPAVIAVAIDTAINFGGLYPYLFNIPQTEAWLQLARAFPGFIPVDPASWLVGFLGLIVCAAIAGSPELIWKGR